MSEPVSGGAPAAAPAVNTPNTAAAPEAAEADLADAEGAEAADEGAEGSAPKSPAEKKEAKKQAEQRKKYKLKVDGREEDVEIDLSNDEEVKKHLQMSRAAQKRMQQFTEYQKSLQGFIEELRTNPQKVLSDPRLNIDPAVRKKLAEQIINGEIEEMQKSPEQREREKLQKELDDLRKKAENEKKAREEAEFKRLQEQASVQLDTEISQAIETGGLPKTSYTVKKMAEAMMLCLEHNLDLSAKEIVPLIKKQTLSDLRELLTSLPDDQFEEWLGKDQISRIRKRNLAKLKAAQSMPETPASVKPTGNEVKPKETTQDKVNLRDFLKGLGR